MTLLLADIDPVAWASALVVIIGGVGAGIREMRKTSKQAESANDTATEARHDAGTARRDAGVAVAVVGEVSKRTDDLAQRSGAMHHLEGVVHEMAAQVVGIAGASAEQLEAVTAMVTSVETALADCLRRDGEQRKEMAELRESVRRLDGMLARMSPLLRPNEG